MKVKQANPFPYFLSSEKGGRGFLAKDTEHLHAPYCARFLHCYKSVRVFRRSTFPACFFFPPVSDTLFVCTAKITSYFTKYERLGIILRRRYTFALTILGQVLSRGTEGKLREFNM